MWLHLICRERGLHVPNKEFSLCPPRRIHAFSLRISNCKIDSYGIWIVSRSFGNVLLDPCSLSPWPIQSSMLLVKSDEIDLIFELRLLEFAAFHLEWERYTRGEVFKWRMLMSRVDGWRSLRVKHARTLYIFLCSDTGLNVKTFCAKANCETLPWLDCSWFGECRIGTITCPVN